MDRVTQYRQVLQQIVLQHSRYQPSEGEIEVIPIIDKRQDQYQVIHVGWAGRKRIYNTLHLSLRDSKVRIHNDPTEEGIASELLSHGIPESDIVLDYQAPYLRQYTSFGKG